MRWLPNFYHAILQRNCIKNGHFPIIPEAFPGVLGNRGKEAFILEEQMQIFVGNRGTKTILGNREHKKTNFRFLGTRGTNQLISGELGNKYPSLGGPHSDVNFIFITQFTDNMIHFLNPKYSII